MQASGFVPAGHAAYMVRKGDTVWRIAQAFGVTPAEIVQANRLSSRAALRIGQRLTIPAPRARGGFLWPARGAVARGAKAPTTIGRPGVEIQALAGSYVRASRTGRVVVAANRVADLGPTVILDHGDGYVTVYCGLNDLLVSPGLAVAQGAPVGRLGSGPLYFEVRYHARPRDPLKVLQ